MKRKLKIDSHTFKVRTEKIEEVEVLICRIRCSSGEWIETAKYPNNAIGYSAVLDLAMNVLSEKLQLEGLVTTEVGKMIESKPLLLTKEVK